MKRLLGLLVAISFAVCVWAACCTPPEGYTFRQDGQSYCENGSSSLSIKIYQAKNACDAYCVCYNCSIYYVSKSDKDGYKYVFYTSGGEARYFNM